MKWTEPKAIHLGNTALDEEGLAAYLAELGVEKRSL